MKATAAELRYMGMVKQLQCVVGKRHGGCEGTVHFHHIAAGSSKRSHYSGAPLCKEHHAMFHAGTRSFCKLFRVPWEKEEGLLVWTAEDLHLHVSGLLLACG